MVVYIPDSFVLHLVANLVFLSNLECLYVSIVNNYLNKQVCLSSHVHFKMSLESGIWTTSASEQETGSVKVDLELGFRCPLCPGVSNDSKWYELPQAELFNADPLHLPPLCEGSADTAAEEQQQWSSSSAKGLQCGECSSGSIHQSWHYNKRSLWWDPNSLLPCESNFPLHVLQDSKGELDWEWG